MTIYDRHGFFTAKIGPLNVVWRGGPTLAMFRQPDGFVLLIKHCNLWR